jgi:AcrR family transcriptional regulator
VAGDLIASVPPKKAAPPKKAVPPRQATRDKVLRAAVQTLAAQGYAASTARAIAATGGFAPGVIYYHFEDLEDLLVATMRFTSEQRIARYLERTADITTAGDLIATLRELYTEDADTGHIAAVQELVAGAGSSSRLSEQVRALVRRWEDLAADVIGRFVAGTPLELLLPLRAVAIAAVAFYLGIEMLSHLDSDRSRPETVFEAATGAAAMVDALRAM